MDDDREETETRHSDTMYHGVLDGGTGERGTGERGEMMIGKKEGSRCCALLCLASVIKLSGS